MLLFIGFRGLSSFQVESTDTKCDTPEIGDARKNVEFNIPDIMSLAVVLENKAGESSFF